MSICDTCIHDDVCGLEDNHEEGIVSCADRIPKDVFDKIREEIEPKCDRINSLASTLRYPAHREIQELLCDILELLQAENEDKE